VFAILAIGVIAARTPGRRAEPAAVPVRFTEGSVHGFLALTTTGGAPLAHGDLFQVARDGEIDSRLVFHFVDSSVFEETVTFTQQDVFVMQSYRLVQTGPAFADDIVVTLARSGEYVVNTKSHGDGSAKRYSGKLDLPPDVYNGMIITIAKNLAPHETQMVHLVAFTPEPRVIGLEIAPTTSRAVMLGQHEEPAMHFTLKPKLGALLGFFASVAGKAPPNSDVWIVMDDVPAFVRFEGPMYSGPVWRLDLTSPSWP
jgi:hypothetical protein